MVPPSQLNIYVKLSCYYNKKKTRNGLESELDLPLGLSNVSFDSYESCLKCRHSDIEALDKCNI